MQSQTLRRLSRRRLCLFVPEWVRELNKRYVRRGLSIDPNNPELKAAAAQIPKVTKPAAPVVAEAQQGQAGRGETAPAGPVPASNTQDYDSPSELFGRLKKLFGD